MNDPMKKVHRFLRTYVCLINRIFKIKITCLNKSRKKIACFAGVTASKLFTSIVFANTVTGLRNEKFLTGHFDLLRGFSEVRLLT